jgi:hypothetical protein
VPASLPTLRHDDVNSAGGCPPRLFSAADCVQNDSVGVVDLLDVAGGIAPHQRHDPHPGFNGLVKATVLIGGDNQIAAKRTIGERLRLANHVSGGSGPRQGHMPSAPAFETAAASWGTADIGAWTIGCSIPSSSQTGVRTNTTDPFAPARSASNQLDVDPSGQRRQVVGPDMAFRDAVTFEVAVAGLCQLGAVWPQHWVTARTTRRR